MAEPASSQPQKRDIRQEMVLKKEQKEVTKIFVWAITLEIVILAFVSLLGIVAHFFTLPQEISSFIKDFFPRLVVIAVFFILLKLILDLVRVSITRAVRKYKGTETTGLMLWRFISYSIWLIVIILVLLTFVGGAWAYMVWVGVIIAAVIYALANTLQNIAAWILVVVGHPFKIGDIIEMGGTRGYVVDVNLNNTVVREMGNWVQGDLFTGRVVSIPNRAIFEKGVANYTRFNNLIYDYLTVSITYESDLHLAEKKLLEATMESADLGDKVLDAVHDAETMALIRMMPREPKVFWQFKDSCIELGVLYPVSMKKRFVTRSNITKRYMDMIKEEPTLSIAYPHMELVKHELSKDREGREVA